jgi:hypothetical protein
MKYNIITQVLNIEISLHFHNQNESTPTNTLRKMDRKWSKNAFLLSFTLTTHGG